METGADFTDGKGECTDEGEKQDKGKRPARMAQNIFLIFLKKKLFITFATSINIKMINHQKLKNYVC